MLARRFIHANLVAVLILLVSAPLDANPSTDSLHAPLPLLDTNYEKMHADATSVYNAEDKRVEQLHKTFLEKKLTARNMGELGKANVGVSKLSRLSMRLTQVGEPSGIDFGLRHNRLRKKLSQMIVSVRIREDAKPIVKKIQDALRKSANARKKQSEAITTLVKQGKWLQAETALYKAFDGIKDKSCFLPHREQVNIFRIFGTLEEDIRLPMESQRRDEANERLVERRNTIAPSFDDLLGEIAEATGDIGSNGTATVGGKNLTGPQLIQYIAGQWRQIHIQSLRCRGIEWARCAVVGKTQTSELRGFEKKHGEFSKNMIQSIAGVVSADAGRVSGADVDALYQAYLTALAPLVARSTGDDLLRTCNAALTKLANKSPGFAKQVTDYRAATDELLRWRARAASAMATARSAQFQPLDAIYLKSLKKSDEFGGFTVQDADSKIGTYAELIVEAPAVLAVAKEKLVGQSVMIGPSVVLASRKGAIGQYDFRAYASLAVPPPPQAEIDRLRADLLVDDSHPPLSLNAATALYSAQRGDPAAAGGQLSAAHLEALVTRFATLPESAWVLTSLGPFRPEHIAPSEYNTNPGGGAAQVMAPFSLQQMLMRFSVQPQWVQYRHIFVELPAVEAAE